MRCGVTSRHPSLPEACAGNTQRLVGTNVEITYGFRHTLHFTPTQEGNMPAWRTGFRRRTRAVDWPEWMDLRDEDDNGLVACSVCGKPVRIDADGETPLCNSCLKDVTS